MLRQEQSPFLSTTPLITAQRTTAEQALSLRHVLLQTATKSTSPGAKTAVLRQAAQWQRHWDMRMHSHRIFLETCRSLQDGRSLRRSRSQTNPHRHRDSLLSLRASHIKRKHFLFLTRFLFRSTMKTQRACTAYSAWTTLQERTFTFLHLQAFFFQTVSLPYSPLVQLKLHSTVIMTALQKQSPRSRTAP